MDVTITLPSRPRVVEDKGVFGVFEIDNLYPGYGHTIGNSLRRILLSSLPGAAITHVRVEGAAHEFSTLEGVKEDVLTILLYLKRVRFAAEGNENEYEVSLAVKGPKVVTAADIKTPSQIRVLNPEQYLFEITEKKEVRIDCVVQQGIGYVPRDRIQPKKADVGLIVLDAAFSPIRRVNYEVEQMRVGDRTDFNRLRITIETDGTLTAQEALERSIRIMLDQLHAMVGISDAPEGEVAAAQTTPRSREQEPLAQRLERSGASALQDSDTGFVLSPDALKTRIETLNLNMRIINALSEAGIRTVGGLVRKRRKDLLALEGIGERAVEEIEQVLRSLGVVLKSDE
ncbi:MAG: DNA-directed RNA polymerase subunit alpha [Candidatus Parcubacteria bacterium]|nr:MAG: DNA-directed RNA polymerase subunit alpha [Candidatus Parcubacteria bacterium]